MTQHYHKTTSDVDDCAVVTEIGDKHGISNTQQSTGYSYPLKVARFRGGGAKVGCAGRVSAQITHQHCILRCSAYFGNNDFFTNVEYFVDK